mgnify:CR=1 FL=1
MDRTGNSFIAFHGSTFPEFNGYVGRVEIYGGKDVGFTNSTATARMIIGNSRTNEYESALAVVLDGSGNALKHTFNFPGNVLFTGTDLYLSSMQIKIEYASGDMQRFAMQRPTVTTESTIILFPATTGQFISDISTITGTITTWGTFDSIRNTNGGSIDFFIRTSTSSLNISTQIWASITPGVRINAPEINNYVQWAATIASVSSFTNTTNIDNVAINHIEGSGSKNRPFATEWNNEYWLSIATETVGNFSIQYVKAWDTN